MLILQSREPNMIGIGDIKSENWSQDVMIMINSAIMCLFPDPWSHAIRDTVTYVLIGSLPTAYHGGRYANAAKSFSELVTWLCGQVAIHKSNQANWVLTGDNWLIPLLYAMAMSNFHCCGVSVFLLRKYCMAYYLKNKMPFKLLKDDTS